MPVDPESEDLLVLLAATVARSYTDSAEGSLTEKASVSSSIRERRDRCPGALRPWPADDGLLVRLRLVGGRVSSAALGALVDVAEAYGDGRVYVTSRANLQVRGLPGEGGRLVPEALAALEVTGLLPSRSHELVRNIMVSPQTGLTGGWADLRPVADKLDRLLCASPRLAELPGRFLFVLDDGRGDLVERPCDLGLVALDADEAQLRIGARWGPVVPLDRAAERLAGLALAFLDVRNLDARGSGPTVPWHISELDDPIVPPEPADDRVPGRVSPLPHGDVPGGCHVPVPEAGLGRAEATALVGEAVEVVVTPWRGVLVPTVGGDHRG